jgi:ATP-dependent Lhr-like helicase
MLGTLAPATTEPESELGRKLLEALANRGAQFFTDLVVAAGAPHPDVLEALWDLVWAGAVTNDTFAPVRALSWPRRSGSAQGSARGRIGRLPPESAGRWSLVRSTPPEETRAALTARSHARAESLLERLGIVTREGVAAEETAGGFSAVYPVLKAMEDAGRVRRGYFVEGLGAAQFALSGAAERLRAERDAPDEPIAVVLAATDPAQPYGATLPWPRDDSEARKAFQRVPGARVVLVDGLPVLYLDRGHRGVLTFPAADAADAPDAADGPDAGRLGLAARAIAEDPAALGARGFSIERIDGAPADESPLAGILLDLGFVRGFRGLTKRPRRAEAVAHA